jgi:hypothetical protein
VKIICEIVAGLMTYKLFERRRRAGEEEEEEEEEDEQQSLICESTSLHSK